MARDGGVRLVFFERRRDKALLEGWTGESLLPLNDGRYLRFSMSLFLEPHNGATRLKDEAGERWMVRYDYLRDAPEPHPGAHVQIRGDFTEPHVRPVHETMERVHFPTGRVALEAIIRMLIEQFGVPTNEPPEVWRRVLTTSEAEFLRIAHRDVSGPLM